MFEARCSDLGKIPSSRGCSSHLPDAFTLAQSRDDRVHHLLDISNLMSMLSPRELQVLAGLMLREKITRRAGFQFMQKVYVRVSGNGSELFLNDFAVGYVLDATKDYVRVIGERGGMAITAINDADRSMTLYTVPRFAELRAEMARKRNIVNPKSLASVPPPPSTDYNDAVIPLEKLEENFRAKGKARKAPKDDLTSLVSRMGRGLLKPRVGKPNRPAKDYDSEDGISISHE